MKENKILRFGEMELKLIFAFEERNQRTFTTGDAKRILRSTDASAKNVLKRLARKGRAIRIERGKYLFAPMAAGKAGKWGEDSLCLVPALVGAGEYYVGLLTALNYWEMTEQIPLIVYVVTKKKKKPLSAFGMKYVFVNMKIGEYGQEEVRGVKLNISSREQAILDCLSRPEYSLGIAEVAKAIHAARKEMDWGRLVGLCLMGKDAVRRRLGYLLEALGEKKRAARLAKKCRGFVWLDPHAEKKRLGYSRKWGVILNVREQDILEFERGY
jgi:predicted transcriptional regulator of viral defense system